MSLPKYISKPFQNMKFTFISGITVSVVVRLGAPLCPLFGPLLVLLKLQNKMLILHLAAQKGK